VLVPLALTPPAGLPFTLDSTTLRPSGGAAALPPTTSAAVRTAAAPALPVPRLP
jgi:hypothetical protein